MVQLLKQTYSLLTRQERIQFFVLVLFALFSSVIQALGIGAIFPFLALLVEPDHLVDHSLLKELQATIGLDEQDFLLALGLGAILLFILGLLFKSGVDLALQRFAFGRQLRFGLLLLEEKLDMPYEDYLERNSSEAITQQTQHLRRYTLQFLSAALRGLSDSILVLAIGSLLVFSAPLLAVVLGIIIGGGYALFLRVSETRMQRMADAQRSSTISQTRIVGESMGGFKEIKVLGRTQQAVRRFGEAVTSYFSAYIRFEILRLIPWLGLQILIVLTLFGLIVYFLKWKGSASEVVALLGFFGLATRQLIPALTGVFASIQSMKQVRPVAEDITESLLRLESRPGKEENTGISMNRDQIRPLKEHANHIALQNVSFRYANSQRTIVRGIDLEIPKNSSVALVGSTGAGKTTLVDLIIGLLRPQEGAILIDGEELTKDPQSLRNWQNRIGYVPQAIFLADASVRENIAFGLATDEIDEKAVQEAAKIAQIHDYIVTELSDGYDTLVGERGIRLSGGQQQRLGIARALYHRPDVLVLDEATSALDNQTERNLTEAIEALGKDHTLVIIAHRLSTVKKCDQVVVLADGSIRSRGSYDSLLTSCPEFQQLANLVER